MVSSPLNRPSVLLVGIALIGCELPPSPEPANSAALPEGYSLNFLPEADEYVSETGLPAGEWRNESGMLICDGYMTRFADQDYCAAEVPEDWTEFEFDGRKYYVQPLADVNDSK